MRRYIIPLCLCLIAAACKDELRTPSDDLPETVLLLDGWLSSADTLHTIKVAASSLSNGIIEARDVKVSIYVNGVLKDESDSVTVQNYCTSEFVLKALFGPGDLVEVRADSPMGSARASSEILPAPTVSNLTYEGNLRMSYYDYSEKREGDFDLLRFDLHDVPGRGNNYHIGIFRTSRHVLVSSESDNPYIYHKPVGFTVDYPLERFAAYNMLEPAMQQDWGKTEYSNSDFVLFDDRFFDGETYKVSVLSLPYPSLSYSYGEGEVWSFTKKAIVRVEAVSEDAYRYYSGVEYSVGGNSGLSAFNEPPIPPYNVEGGIGFVCFASAVELDVNLPEVLYGWGID